MHGSAQHLRNGLEVVGQWHFSGIGPFLDYLRKAQAADDLDEMLGWQMAGIELTRRGVLDRLTEGAYAPNDCGRVGVPMAGLARVTAIQSASSPKDDTLIVATPLYVEYSTDDALYFDA